MLASHILNLNGVYQYGEKITEKGLVFVDSPGYDPVSITGEVASGCNMICFTTWRGSCYGNKPVPSIKIAANSAMYDRMRDDMDINCGTIAAGSETVAEADQRISTLFWKQPPAIERDPKGSILAMQNSHHGKPTLKCRS
jgi:altronate dehydratase